MGVGEREGGKYLYVDWRRGGGLIFTHVLTFRSAENE
jgi:hypothetical protein